VDHELEAVFKSWVEQAERYWHTWDNNPKTSAEVYWKDVVPYKYLLRQFYVKNDRPVCWGAVDCITLPLSMCPAGKHEICGEHESTCFLCKAEADGK
jgi:hypothetical protein